MKRREFLKMAGAATVSALTAPGLDGAEPVAARRPNILLLFPDQHRHDWTSLNPALPDITPQLKALAGEGTSFASAFCPSPVCASSRACLALGRDYHGCGVAGNGESLALDATTFYKLLRDKAGYQVLGCGKFDLDKPGRSWGLDGKHRRDGLPSLLEVWGFSDGIDNAGKQDGAKNTHPEPYHAYLQRVKGTATADEAYGDNWIARNGLELIRAVPQGTPWFLQVNFNGPHPPFDPTGPMLEAWASTPFPPTVPGHADDTGQRRRYAAEIANIDRWIAVYREELRRRGELDSTIMVYSSDHGEMLHDHGYEGKSRPLQPSVCVPLVLAGPGIRPGVQFPAAAATLDLAATFLDYAGVAVPGDMDSRSLRPYLEGRGAYPRTHVTSALGGWRLVSDGRFKLIAGSLGGMVQAKDGGKPSVLYDLSEDAAETVDLSSAHPEMVTRLAELLPPEGEPGKGRGRGKGRRGNGTAHQE